MTWSVFIREASDAAALEKLEAAFSQACAGQPVHQADLPAIGKMASEVCSQTPLKEGHDRLIKGHGALHYDYEVVEGEGVYTPTGAQLNLEIMQAKRDT